MKSLIANLLAGRSILQSLFERLHRLSLTGMNYGRGSSTNHSGEKRVLYFLKERFASEKIVVFDIGANQGQYALLVADVIDSNVEIHAFEPSHTAFKELVKNIRETDVKCYNFGFGNSNELINLYFDEPGSAWASFYPIKHDHIGKHLTNSEVVNVQTLREFILDQKVSQIHLCKIDVEGNEFKVLEGAGELLNSGIIKMIQFEIGPASLFSKVFLRDFFRILDSYRIYRVLKDGLYPLQYSERYEIFLTTNYLAIFDQPSE